MWDCWWKSNIGLESNVFTIQDLAVTLTISKNNFVKILIYSWWWYLFQWWCECRSLIANLSAANCYKVEHLKRPENWALGILSWFYFVNYKLSYGRLIHSYLPNSRKGQILLYCWILSHCFPRVYFTCCWACCCKQQGITTLMLFLYLPCCSNYTVMVFNIIRILFFKVFTANLSAPFICEFFKDVQEKTLL